MLEEMIKKIKSGEDLTPEEAVSVYWETKETEFHKLRKPQTELHAWFSAIADVLKKDRKAMDMRKKIFITAIPIFTGSSEYKLGINAFEVYEKFGYVGNEKTKEDVMERFYEFMVLPQDDGR